jgi:HAD superfamily hydrolase (TIGR01490 family)
MRVALFDLDHTLIPFDSGLEWTRFLIGRGRLDAIAEARYIGFGLQYVAGTLDIHAMHRANVEPLRHHPLETLHAWACEFEAEIAPRVPASMRALVDRHRNEGHLCAIVTATTRLIAAPLARIFGVHHLLATEAGAVDGLLTGDIAGVPCFREHKLTHVDEWLAGQGTRLQTVERSWFYSDSIGDLPLMNAVTDPVAVTPDASLRAEAAQRGWPVIDNRD